MADEREKRRGSSGQGGGAVGGGGGAGDAPNLEAHPLVRRLRREDDEPAAADAVVLTGYLGPSKVGDNVRLYADLTFRTYYEIPRAAVRRTVAGADEDDPTQVWVDSSARVEVVQTTRQSVEAGYLGGAIAGQFAGASARAAGAGAWPVCKTVVTANPTDCGPYCLTVVTANPTDCGPVCLTVVTAVPTDCGMAAAGAQAAGRAAMAGQQVCITLLTARPTSCGPKPCDTQNPTQCPICLTVVTAVPTDCGPQAGAAGAFGGGAGAARQQFCITRYTARPTSCGQQFCITLDTAIPTWCEGGGMVGGQICLTVVTANPTDCGGGRCLPIRTLNPTMCGPICLTVVTAVPTDCG